MLGFARTALQNQAFGDIIKIGFNYVCVVDGGGVCLCPILAQQLLK
jgi:hypothetical protein